MLLVTTPVTWFMLRMPAAVEAATIEARPAMAAATAMPAATPTMEPGARPTIFGGRPFWFIIISIGMYWMAIQGLRVHFVSLGTDHGIGLATASAALSLMGRAAFIGNISIGWLMDRFNVPWIVVPFFCLSVVGLAIVGLTTSTALLLLGALILGIGTGAKPPPPRCWCGASSR